MEFIELMLYHRVEARVASGRSLTPYRRRPPTEAASVPKDAEIAVRGVDRSISFFSAFLFFQAHSIYYIYKVLNMSLRIVHLTNYRVRNKRTLVVIA